ncbi:MAG: DUF4834 domain-containing protein [Flavobacteriaceae bacterium]
MGILKTILVILLVYYLFRLLARWFAPKLFVYAARRTEERFKEQFGDYQSFKQEEDRPVGDVSIDKKPTNSNRSSSDVGEYIEFEELE